MSTLEQLVAQFERLTGTTASGAGPAPVRGGAGPAPANEAKPTPEAGDKPAPTVQSRPATPAPAAPPSPVQITDPAIRGVHLDVTVSPLQVVQAAELLDREGFGLDAVSGVDWLAQDQMEVVYDFFHPQAPHRVAVRARVPRAAPELPTISTVFPGANWHEREAHDFFGLTFSGHPNLTPFLLPEDADFHPLRKDYQP